jgi:hypothetical protein
MQGSAITYAIGHLLPRSYASLREDSSATDTLVTLAMTFAVTVAAKQRPKYGSNLIYGYPGQLNQRWMT